MDSLVPSLPLSVTKKLVLVPLYRRAGAPNGRLHIVHRGCVVTAVTEDLSTTAVVCKIVRTAESRASRWFPGTCAHGFFYSADVNVYCEHKSY